MGYATKLKQQYAHFATLEHNVVAKERDKRNQAGVFYKPESSGRSVTVRGKQKRKGCSLPPREYPKQSNFTR